MFEYKAGFKWWRGNAWSSPRREKKKESKEGRKEDTHTYQGGQKGGKEMKKKKLSLLFGVKDATTCNAASQC